MAVRLTIDIDCYVLPRVLPARSPFSVPSSARCRAVICRVLAPTRKAAMGVGSPVIAELRRCLREAAFIGRRNVRMRSAWLAIVSDARATVTLAAPAG